MRCARFQQKGAISSKMAPRHQLGGEVTKELVFGIRRMPASWRALARIDFPSTTFHSFPSSTTYPIAQCLARLRSRSGLLLSRLYIASRTSENSGSSLKRSHSLVSVCSSLTPNISLTRPLDDSQSSLTAQLLPSAVVRSRPINLQLSTSAAAFVFPGRCQTSVI